MLDHAKSLRPNIPEDSMNFHQLIRPISIKFQAFPWSHNASIHASTHPRIHPLLIYFLMYLLTYCPMYWSDFWLLALFLLFWLGCVTGRRSHTYYYPLFNTHMFVRLWAMSLWLEGWTWRYANEMPIVEYKANEEVATRKSDQLTKGLWDQGTSACVMDFIHIMTREIY